MRFFAFATRSAVRSAGGRCQLECSRLWSRSRAETNIRGGRESCCVPNEGQRVRVGIGAGWGTYMRTARRAQENVKKTSAAVRPEIAEGAWGEAYHCGGGASQLVAHPHRAHSTRTYSASTMCFWNSESGPSLDEVTTSSQPLALQKGTRPSAFSVVPRSLGCSLSFEVGQQAGWDVKTGGKTNTACLPPS